MLITSGVAVGFTVFLYFLLSYTLPMVVDEAIADSVISSVIGLPVLFAFLQGGGLACIQHFALRLVLYNAKQIPWNFVSFFESAEERLFIQRTGGSYVFVHRYLQDYFAENAPSD
jgi:hypothetical protein